MLVYYRIRGQSLGKQVVHSEVLINEVSRYDVSSSLLLTDNAIM